MFLATAHEQASWDEAFAQQTGLSKDFLMEQAALLLAIYCEQKWEYLLRGEPVRIFCGSGHNGGDGYALARMLAARGYRVEIYETGLTRSRPGIVGLNRDACRRMELPLYAIEDYMPQVGLHIDAIYGSGYRHRLQKDKELEFFQQRMRAARERFFDGYALLAVDLPSGLEVDSGFGWKDLPIYDVALAMGQGKLCMVFESLRDKVLHWQNLPLSIPAQVYTTFPPQQWRTLFTEEKLFRLWPKTASAAHKGTLGQVGIVAGSKGMSGAGLLSLEAALLSGAGRIYAALPEEAVGPALLRHPAALVQERPVFSSESEAGDFMHRFLLGLGRSEQAVCLLGPGLGNEEWTGILLEEALGWPGQVILDASALAWISSSVENLRRFVELCQRRLREHWPKPLLTPHVGEYRALLKTWSQLLVQNKSILSVLAKRVITTQSEAVASGDRSAYEEKLTPILEKGSEPDSLDLILQLCSLVAENMGCVIYRKSAASFLAWHLPPEEQGCLAEALLADLGQSTKTLPVTEFTTWISAGTSALARAGSGDVLAGLAAGLTARFTAHFKSGEQGPAALLSAAFLCGQTAEKFTKLYGHAYFSVATECMYLQDLLADLLERKKDAKERI